MRDPNRINKFCTSLAEIWSERVPDWRFGQLCSNFFCWLMTEKKLDYFFPEEVQMEKYLYEYLDSFKHEK